MSKRNTINNNIHIINSGNQVKVKTGNVDITIDVDNPKQLLNFLKNTSESDITLKSILGCIKTVESASEKIARHNAAGAWGSEWLPIDAQFY